MSLPAILFCVLLAPLLIVLFSIDAVEQNEYGLKFNWVTKSLSKDVYHGGTHMVGFWNKFLVFPATVRSIEFSDRIGMSQARMLHTRTKEGLALHLSISFQYKLNPDKLHELFAVTNMAYESLYIRIAREQLLEAASEYEGPQYWQERQKIGDHMRHLVDSNLKENYASLWGLQLQVIDLPDRYEQSITETQVQQQIIRTRINEQAAAGIRADTDVLTAEYDKKIQVVMADAQANYTQETKLANAEAAKRRIKAEAETVGYVRKKLKLSAEDLVRYQQLQSYAMLANATFMADMPQASAMIGLASAMAPAAGMLQTRQAKQASEAGDEIAVNSVVSADAKQPVSFMERKWRRSSVHSGSESADVTFTSNSDAQ